MKLAIALGGSDHGRSGIGVYVDRVLPRVRAEVERGGGELLVLGTELDRAAYNHHLDGVEFVAVPVDQPGPSAAWYLTAVTQTAKKYAADVLLLPAANRRTSMVPLLPTVSVVHDLAQLHVAKKYDPLRMFYFRYVMIPSLRFATRLVAVSHATKRDVIDVLGDKSPPIDVVWNGVDAKRFAPVESADTEGARVRSQLGLEDPYFLYAARLEHPGKNHIRLVQAFKRSGLAEQYTLALAGKDWGAEQQIRDAAAAHGLEGRVRFLGFVADEVMPPLVRGASLVIMAGLHEGFGLPALEAAAAGVPTCASKTGALPEVVGDFGVLFDPLDVDSIGQALATAVSDDALAERVREQGPGFAAEHTWDATAAGLVRACRDALEP